MIFSNDPRGASHQIIKYPNYTIEPIMGTNRLLESGKTYAMNCEFYTGRKPILGYYAQYTVNANGDGFDTSHENSKVSLVHYTKARDFLAGKELTRPGSSEKNTYFVGMRGSASLLNLLYGIPFDWYILSKRTLEAGFMSCIVSVNHLVMVSPITWLEDVMLS